ncbi:chlorophyll synthesis pathway protein BchC [Cladophialophora bantiana CBS 173.52]|uniref:Chlorophyll synthesis pathway protein BchC n=1 Tax=Cladophialophora bantiana (strain ATCC 10958 / CBS 173.52 / CDC B-1940 / NIH 8579) TaxID=1442370 RepID=A0A0D2H8S1_CLAB1|nr:chlorophyll synthesis pathway protein BchC [Cladophialophora bantiana CBS 173.52]KIW87285.1 chlorophyll synthesis pathway protein BchC [Cladophialophora bantiana CBS 173.52]
MTMIKAVRFHGKGDVRLDTIPALECGPDELRVEVAYCGICGTDVHEYLGGPIFPPQHGCKNPHTGVSLPVVLGHEFSGTIIEIGSKVTGFQLGQHVAVNPSLDDVTYGLELCTACRAGRPNICKRWACLGLSGPGGGFSDEVVVNSHCCIPLPEGVSLKAGALAEPLAVASHMIRLSGFKKGDCVAVLGAGPIGLALLLLLKALGASAVVISEIAESRILQAQKFGADEVVDPRQASLSRIDPLLEAIQKFSPDGADISFDTTGLQATLDSAVVAVKPGGVVFNVAIHEKPLSFNPNDFAFQEKKFMGGICYTNEDFVIALEAIRSGAVPADDFVTSVVPLEDIVQGGFMELIQNKEHHVKILIQPSLDGVKNQ